jgi:hypothetical protein
MRRPTASGGGVSSNFRAENSVVNRVLTRVTLAGVYCESRYPGNAETVKLQRLNGIAAGFSAQPCITPLP